MKNIYMAFIKAQSEMGNPTKNTTNTFFKASYANLNEVRAAVLPALNANGIAVLQPHVNIDGKNFVNTKLIHESGECIDSYTEIIVAKQNDPQALGSATSYARRHGLQSLVCVGAEDDDGEAAMNRNPKPEQQQKAKPITKTASTEKAQSEAEAEELDKKTPATKEQMDLIHSILDNPFFSTEQREKGKAGKYTVASARAMIKKLNEMLKEEK